MTTITIDRAVVQQALEALEMSRRFVYADNRPQCDEAIAALRAALAQQDEPKGGGNLPPPLQAKPVQEPVAWYRPSIAPDYYAPVFVAGAQPPAPLTQAEARLLGWRPLVPPKAEPVQEPDLSRCPQCNGPADNGHDRSIPPNPYLCTKCMAEPAREQVIEDAIEAAYWHFDARKKGLNEWASAPQSERDAFKAEARKLVRGYFPTRQAQDTKREMLAVADAFIRGKRAALAQQDEPAWMHPWPPVRAQQEEPDHETRAEIAEQRVVQLAEERDHYRNLWQKAQQAEPAQEPVAWVNQANLASARITRDRGGQGDTHTWSETRSDYHNVPLCTAAPRRRLTDDEIGRLWFQAKIPGLTETSARLLIRAAEEALRSKGAPA